MTGTQGDGNGAPPPTGAPGMLGNPGLLAAGAGACASAFCALWAFHALPLGSLALWLSPLPLFLAGLGFGAGSGVIAAALATLLVGLTAGGAGTVLYATLFAVPAAALLVLALRGGRVLDLSAPLVFLGAWPLAVLAIAAMSLTGEGGFEATMRRAVESALARLGVTAQGANAELVAMVVRFKAAAFGLFGTAALVLNGLAAHRFLERRALARAAAPPVAALRLPGWYPLLPALAFGAWLAAPSGNDAVAFSALLLLLLPPFYLGIAGVHWRARGRRARLPLLLAFYILMLVFLQLIAPMMIALGFTDHFRRRRGAAPT